MTLKIGIFGDSWGSGEWNHDINDYRVLHRGVEQYLVDDGYTVENYSIPAGSNHESYLKIKENHQAFDHIIWFTSEPSRDFQNWNYFYNKEKPHLELPNRNHDDLDSICKENFQRQLTETQSLCKNIMFVGGLTGARAQSVVNFTADVKDLVGYEGEEYYIHPGCFGEDAVEIVRKKYPNEVKNQENFFNFIIHNKKWFWPDGIHPNRHLHKLIYDKIKTELDGH